MSQSSSLWWSKPSAILSYAVAALSVAAALVAGLLLDTFLQTDPFASLFICAILFVAWFGGVGPGLLAAALSILAFAYYFAPPIDSFGVEFKEIPRIVLFAIAALFVLFLSAAQRSAVDKRKHAEEALRLARIELARVMQMTAMGQMAASIAHEINQPLAAIVANSNAGLNWLASETPDLDEAREALKCIVNDGHLASEVIGGIRSMFKKNDKAEAPQDANELVREVLALLHREIQSQQVLIRSEFAEGLPQISANRVQLQQVIVNLIMNAVDAMSTVVDRARILRVKTEVHEFNYLLITVEDSGTGIDPKNINRVFDAFFTTKSHGMGMGLSICRSIIESHGGRLWVSPGQPHGSIFHALLPTGGIGAKR